MIKYNLNEINYTAQVGDNQNYSESSLVIPETVEYNSQTYDVTSIGDDAFAHCSNLTSVTFNNGLQTIWLSAFEGCSALTSISIPASVTLIYEGAFGNCNNLTSITVDGENGTFYSQGNCIINYCCPIKIGID